VRRLGAVAPLWHVEPKRGAHPGDLEGRLRHRQRVVLHLGRLQQLAGDDGHLVAERGQAASLAVDVLGDAAQRRIVEIGDDRDPHGGDGTRSPALAL
jgi:hypothetical protein